MNDAKKFFTKTFPVIRDFLIFAAAIVTIAFNYLASPVREDLRITKGKIEAVEGKLQEHESNSTKTINSINQSLTDIKNSINGTERDSLNSRLSRIEGAIQK